MKLKYLIFIALLFWFGLVSCSRWDSNTISIEDFKSGSYSGWKIKGDAFGKKQTGSDNTHRMIGFLGDGYVCTAHHDIYSISGILTTPLFKI